MTDPAEAPGTEVRFHHSDRFPRVLEEAACSLLVSTYQAGQVVAVGVAEGGLSLSFRRFDRAMGVAVGPDRVAVGGKTQVWTLRDHSEIAPAMAPVGRYDRCWLPRSSVVTGPISCHELAWGTTGAGEPDLWVVNTAFSCLAGLDERHSFEPRWRPPFVSALAAQDRCHLNGLAMRAGRPAFVSLFAPSDEPGGWRATRNDSGTVLDVASGEAVTTGLAMPHSPRWYAGALFVLNSGLGRLERVDLATGSRDVVATFPGYARGLALHRGLAFVGLSRIRETNVFGGAPIAAYHDQLKCGVGVVDLRSGTTVATLQFENGVEEIFDVQVVPGARCPTFGEDDVWVLPA
ncbi:TIGR03032 family protein [Nocardioides hungaricus]